MISDKKKNIAYGSLLAALIVVIIILVLFCIKKKKEGIMSAITHTALAKFKRNNYCDISAPLYGTLSYSVDKYGKKRMIKRSYCLSKDRPDVDVSTLDPARSPYIEGEDAIFLKLDPKVARYIDY